MKSKIISRDSILLLVLVIANMGFFLWLSLPEEFFFFSRSLQGNYIGYPVSLLALGYYIDDEQ